jgi:hypothetical protein
MNVILIKNLRLLIMLKALWILLLIPVYLLFFYYSDLLKGVVYIFTTVIVFGPLVSSLLEADMKYKTRPVFYSLPVSRREMELWDTVTAYGLLGLIVAIVFLTSVVMHVCLQWPIMTFGEVLFVLIILNFEGLLESCFPDFYDNVYGQGWKFSFLVLFFFLMSFLVYPYLISSLYRLDFSWPKGSSPIRVTVNMLNRPLPAMVMGLIALSAFGLTFKRSIRNTENRDI